MQDPIDYGHDSSLSSSEPRQAMDDLLANRQKYLQTDQFKATVRPVVRSAWRRCRRYGVDPEHLKAQTPPDARKLKSLIGANAALLEASDSLIEMVHATMGESGHLVALSDCHGTILRLLADPVTQAEAGAGCNFFQGASWHEKDLGCNGIGTALATDEPVILIGPEHFQQAYVSWTCVGIPIHMPDGRTAGALDLSVPNAQVDIRTWGWILSVARAIERRLAGEPRSWEEGQDLQDVDDLGNPFHAIRGVLDLVVRQLGLPEPYKSFLGQASEQVGRAEQDRRKAHAGLESRVRERTAALEQRSEQLQLLASELTVAEQRERRRLASMLHDHLQQLLVGAKLRLRLGATAEGPRRTQEIRQAEQILGEAIEATRSLSAELHPSVLHEHGLAAALEWLAHRMNDSYPIHVDLELDAAVMVEDDRLRSLLFDAARELLFNAVKYAEADRVRVSLHPHDLDTVRLCVEDQGVGFDAPAFEPDVKRGGGLGLFRLRERLGILGGSLVIDSRPGEGTCIEVFASVRQQPAEETPPATTANRSAKAGEIPG